MKIRNGIPTKSAISELIEKHGLITNRLDSWTALGSFAYGYRADADDKAAKIVDELRAEGFEVNHSATDRNMCRRGIVRVCKKTPSNTEITGRASGPG